MFFKRMATGTLTWQTLSKMALRVAVVIVASSAVSYIHMGVCHLYNEQKCLKDLDC